ncbi:pyridoxine/pyridoxamine 5'-phosphate oxidase [Streptomyces montanisoli]|uniref:Pyridoxal 5'-phosphate synthase n=1 Tax=Streptomyces montanisoli TaxID=2798581 RepID=A0A940RXX7_9ACTN|nr:pyridoxal 5'-phosphate synthase [Streptomyces montanisoli]MBP0461035.1 pyridoxal 5'-phosphate synthase [Streptomyces montanisoli]
MRENDAPNPTEPPSPFAFRALLREQRVWDTGDAGLPPFDPAQAPGDPLTLFHLWFAEAAAAGQPEPHTMTLATVGADGLPDARTVMLHDADERGWHFATHTTSRKGRQLAARPYAALAFYWHAQARAVRVRGPVHPVPQDETSADLHARSTGALAAALAGRQSEVLGSREELRSTYESAWRRAERDPAAEAPTWTGHVVVPDEVEFFQGDAHRQHVRLRYVRDVQDVRDAADSGPVWRRELLWP